MQPFLVAWAWAHLTSHHINLHLKRVLSGPQKETFCALRLLEESTGSLGGDLKKRSVNGASGELR